MKKFTISIILNALISQLWAQNVDWDPKVIKVNDVKQIFVYDGIYSGFDSAIATEFAIMKYVFDSNGNISEFQDYRDDRSKTNYFYDKNLKPNLITSHVGNYLKDSIKINYYNKFYVEKHYDFGYQAKDNPIEIKIVRLNSRGLINESLRLYGTYKHWLTISKYDYVKKIDTSIMIINSVDFESIHWSNYIKNHHENNWIELIDTFKELSKGNKNSSVETDSIFYNEKGAKFKSKNDFTKTDNHFVSFKYESFIYSQLELLEQLRYKKKEGWDLSEQTGGFVYKYEFNK